MSKVISFAGVQREDLVYYVSKMLSTCDEPVLVVDNSYQNALFRSVWVNEDEPDVYIRNMVYIKNAIYSKELVENFEYVIVYHGTDVNEDWWNASEYHFMVLNFDRFDIEDMRASVSKIQNSPINVVFTGRYFEKITDRTIVDDLGLSPELIPNVFEIPIDESIEKTRLTLQYNSIVRVDKIPQPMKKIVWDVYKTIVGAEVGKQKPKDVFVKAG